MKDSLGDRMKGLEDRYTHDSFLPTLPVIVRLDGKSFHTWTRGLDRPFDFEFKSLMVEVTKSLLLETHAIIGYSQSDEITLIFYNDNPEGQIYFDGKTFKINSVCSSIATAHFNSKKDSFEKFKNKPLAYFDCRSFQVPNQWEAINCLIWRENDATRNSILSVGQAMFSHKKLQGASCKQIQEMLFQEKGINWNDYSSDCKKGTYLRRLPGRIEEIDMPPLSRIENAPDVIFNEAKPIMKEGSR